MNKTFHRGFLILLAAILLLTCGCAHETEVQKAGFTPVLDTDASVQLDITGAFGNFEALDQVMNAFNEYYPNVTYTYQQLSGEKQITYLESHPEVDLFMISQDTLAPKYRSVLDLCVDLTEAGVNLDAVDPQMLAEYCVDGRQLALPMSQNLYGVVVNVSLLEKEGLSVPRNREEFLTALSVLKEKGYIPVQGPTSKVYAELTSGMVFSGLCTGQPLREAILKGDKAAAAELLNPAFDLLDTLLSEGYTDREVNDSYPNDNYDQAILRFFAGDVPFWVCNSEKVSGMKKRESKSETFQQNPFAYTFIYPPVGNADEGIYREPWFAFAVNKDGVNRDYAVELLRFLATTDQMNQMADVKGVPSAAKESTKPEIYTNVLDEDAIRSSKVNDGSVTSDMVGSWYSCTSSYVNGTYGTRQEAIDAFLTCCMEQIR